MAERRTPSLRLGTIFFHALVLSLINLGSILLATGGMTLFVAQGQDLLPILTCWLGSLPLRKISLTTVGHSAVGSIPEGSHTETLLMPCGTLQPCGGLARFACWMTACHKAAAALGATGLGVF